MELINDYGVFRQACTDFQQKFIEKYLPEGQLVCHPMIKDLIFAPCTDEEAKSNDMTICRLYDMMLMSDNGENNWKPFVLKDAREKAAEIEHIYLSDLLFEKKFAAHDWMIDGKHDQVIVNEQYMREHNKPYAPVTPLTNQKLKIKKIINADFWHEGTVEAPAVITFENIQQNLDVYLNEQLENFPVISDVNEMKLPLKGTFVEINKNGARLFKLEKALDSVYILRDKLAAVAPLINAIGGGMTLSGYAIKFMLAALKKNGIDMKPIEFRTEFYNSEVSALPEGHTPDDELECAKRAFIKAFVKSNTCGFVHTEFDGKAYNAALREIEETDMNTDEIVAAAADILSDRPADAAVFRLLYSVCGKDDADISALEEFWFGEDSAEYTDEQLNAHLAATFIPENAKDKDGNFICGIEQAKIIRDDIRTAADKYKLAAPAVFAELDKYIEEEDKKSRTYNGTVFETAEEMKSAVRNEQELIKLCADLSALDKTELEKLRSHINAMTVDENTKEKYLLKVKLAFNDVEKNQLEQMCLAVADMNSTEAAALKKKIIDGGYDETVAKPFMAKIESRIISAQTEELDSRIKSVEGKDIAAIDAAIKEIDSDKYSNMLRKHYVKKANSVKSELARKELAALCGSVDGLAKDKLAEIKKKIDEKNFAKYIKNPFSRKISYLIDDFDRKEVAVVFANIAKATREELDKLRGIINEGKYDTALTDPYISKISDREQAIGVEEFTAKCEKIGEMDKAALAAIKSEFTSGKYDSSITEKYVAKLSEREVQLEKQEIADLCKDMEKMDIPALTALEKTLSDEKYNKDYTADYFAKIKDYKTSCEKKEIAALCANISSMKKDELAELRKKLSDPKYKKEYTEEFFGKIKDAEDQLEKKEIADLCKDISKADRKALSDITAKISDAKYNKEFTAPYFEQIKKRGLELDNAEVDEICKDIEKKNRAELKTISEKISTDKFDKEYTKKFFDRIKARENELDRQEIDALCKDLDKKSKSDLEKLSADISAKYDKDIAKPFIEKIRAKEIELMKKELDALCKNIPSMPRAELSKLKEALKGDAFDKEISAKYIAQIEQREESLIKTELSELGKNIQTLPKDKLLEIKRKITDTPEYKNAGQTYIDQIDNRLKKLDKEEFDKMMNSIEKMNSDELDKFRDELEKRKPALDNALYINTVHKVDVRFDDLEKEELDKLCGDVTKLSIEKITAVLNDIEDKGYDQKNSAPYIKKLNDAATNIHVSELSKLTENIGGMTKEQLNDVLKKVQDYKNGCPDDLKRRYEGKVLSKIREAEDKQVEALCRNLGTMTMKEKLDLIAKIKDMDIDENAKKRHITDCENHIINDKNNERTEYVVKLTKDMADNMLNDGHLTTPNSKVFESYYIAMKSSFVKTTQFELPILLHEVNQNNPDLGFAVTMDHVFCKDKNGLITKKSIEEISNFTAKKGLFGGGSIQMVDKSGSTTELPNNGFKPAGVEKAANVLNLLIGYINDKRKAERMKAIEQNAARMNMMPEPTAPVQKPTEAAPVKEAAPAPKPAAPAPAPVPAPKPVETAAKPAEKAPEAKQPVTVGVAADIKPIKPIEPIKTTAPVKPAVNTAPAATVVPEIKKPAAPAPAAPKPAAPAAASKPEAPVSAAPAKPEAAPAPKPAAPAPAPASAKPIRMKFCDQCGAKIMSDTAKFCSECGNKISR